MDLQQSSPSLPRLRAVIRHPPLSLLQPSRLPTDAPSSTPGQSSQFPPAVTSLSFHASGRRLYLAYSDGTLRTVRDVCDGAALPTDDGGASQGLINVHAGRHGALTAPPPREVIVRATHHEDSVVVANGFIPPSEGSMDGSVGSGFALQYLSVHDNKVLRNFPHSGADGASGSAPCSSVSMSPVDDRFLSSHYSTWEGVRTGGMKGKNNFVKLWDLRSPNATATMDVPEAVGIGNVRNPPALATFDDTGLVFCVAAPGKWDQACNGLDYKINMYDSRNFSSGPFAEMVTDRASLSRVASAVRPPSHSSAPSFPPVSDSSAVSDTRWTSIQFNRSGSHLLATAADAYVLLIDGYTGAVSHAFSTLGQALNATRPNSPPASELAVSRGPSRRLLPPISGGTYDAGPPAVFSRDDAYVLAGCDDGVVAVWDAKSGDAPAKFDAGHVGKVRALAANPAYGMFVSACANAAVW
eukprot:CAMPEP_0113309778 /NCGR_PEP_ID=MMETSP0010_2-20120614/7683_1 /TAXON_ID=216773 ORGANISM="Corethron hystrix, Strain 308" /NCGR_SAMPLE_ID=MMETSP0010_2 /ASSEMBLY_ACC=CAM_ASM_000155 /LENGTH=467 /DNA_ID=CAMNT_0000165093 /DNA_START=45 /DNA_END=1445 /DNA_ORIENTATION=- /assembly_acc=CAM_ASM_000155